MELAADQAAERRADQRADVGRLSQTAGEQVNVVHVTDGQTQTDRVTQVNIVHVTDEHTDRRTQVNGAHMADRPRRQTDTNRYTGQSHSDIHVITDRRRRQTDGP